MIARERGLEPLARAIFRQDNTPVEPEKFLNPELEVASVEEALAGARDIIAEWLNEDSAARAGLRNLFAAKAVINSKVVKKSSKWPRIAAAG